MAAIGQPFPSSWGESPALLPQTECQAVIIKLKPGGEVDRNIKEGEVWVEEELGRSRGTHYWYEMVYRCQGRWDSKEIWNLRDNTSHNWNSGDNQMNGIKPM